VTATRTGALEAAVAMRFPVPLAGRSGYFAPDNDTGRFG
jgi:hypothetical protein